MQITTVGDGTRLVAGLGDLTEIILREDHGILLLRSVQRRVAHIEQISAKRHMRPMLLQNAERQQAGTLRTFDGLDEVWARQFFPMDRQFGLRGVGLRLREPSYAEDRTKK